MAAKRYCRALVRSALAQKGCEIREKGAHLHHRWWLTGPSPACHRPLEGASLALTGLRKCPKARRERDCSLKGGVSAARGGRGSDALFGERLRLAGSHRSLPSPQHSPWAAAAGQQLLRRNSFRPGLLPPRSMPSSPRWLSPSLLHLFPPCTPLGCSFRPTSACDLLQCCLA